MQQKCPRPEFELSFHPVTRYMHFVDLYGRRPSKLLFDRENKFREIPGKIERRSRADTLSPTEKGHARV